MSGPPSTVPVIGFLDVDGYECQLYQRDQPSTRYKPCVVATSSGRIVSVTPEAKNLGISRGTTPNLRDIPRDVFPYLEVFRKRNLFGKPDTKKTRHGTWELLDAVKKFCKRVAGNDIIIELASSDEIYLELTTAVTQGILKRNSNTERRRFIELDAFTVMEGLTSGHGPFLYDLNHRQSQAYVQHAARDEDRLVFGALFMRELALELQRAIGFSTSSGVASNRFAAKLACGLNKPGKTTVLNQLGLRRVAKNINVCSVPGLGGKLGNQLIEELHVKTLADLRKFSLAQLEKALQDAAEKALEKDSNSDTSDNECDQEQESMIAANASLVFSLARGKDGNPVIEKHMKSVIKCNKPGRPVVSTLPLLIRTVNNLCDECSCMLKEERARHKRIITSIKVEFSFDDDPQQSVVFGVSKYDDLDDKLPGQILQHIMDVGGLHEKGTKFVVETLGVVMKDFIPYIETLLSEEDLHRKLAIYTLNQGRYLELRVHANPTNLPAPKFSHKSISCFGTTANQAYYWNNTPTFRKIISKDKYEFLIGSDLGMDYPKAKLVSDHQGFYELKHRQFQCWLHDFQFIEKVNKGQIHKPHFICFNGRLTDSMLTPMLRQFGEWELYAINVAGIIFLWDEKAPKPQLSLTEFFGIGFESLLRVPKATSATPSPANEAEHTYGITSTTFGEHKLLIASEIDGMDENGNLVELRTRNERLGAARAAKLLKLWTTNIIAGVGNSVIGTRDESGILLDIEEKATEDLENELGPLTTNPCLHFQHRLLSWIKSHLPFGNRDVVMKYTWVCGKFKVHGEQIQKNQVPSLVIPRLYANYLDHLEKHLGVSVADSEQAVMPLAA